MSKKAKRKPPKEKPLKINASLDKAIKGLVTPINLKYYKDREELINRMHDLYECPIHHEKVLGYSINPSSYVIYYETCCKKFSDFIAAKMTDFPLQRD